MTETIFSMDGDEAPLTEIVELAEKYDAWVMVDEAHATGIFGASGAGVVAKLGLGDRVLVQMGTLGKALGGFGAYVAGSRALRELLINRCRSFIFTTALPPAIMATAYSGDRSSGARTGAARGSVGQLPPACGWTEKNRFFAR